MKKIIIVPDVHGRSFWKKLLSLNIEEYDVIFLGDYLDVYPYEHIDTYDAFVGFEEIIELKKKHPDNITLLLGNHDLEYLSHFMPACRMDKIRKNDIKHIFESNINLFKIGTTREVYGRKITFTHACLLKKWVEHNKKFFGELTNADDIINLLNEKLITNIDSLWPVLSQTSFYRGGENDYGSVVWADLDEINEEGAELDGWFEVFGHNQQFSKEMYEEIWLNGTTDKLAQPILNDHYACLDCKQLFTFIEKEGIVKLVTY